MGSSKENILREANRLFAQKSYEGTSIRDIAKAAKVNVASINYHFGSKQGLFETLVKEFTDSKLMMVINLLEHPQTMEGLQLRIKMFMKHFMLLALSEKETVRMLNRNIETFANLAPEIFQNSFVKIHQHFYEFIASAQRAKLIKEDVDAHMLAQILFDGIGSFAKNCEIKKKFLHINASQEEYFEKYISTFVDAILRGTGVNCE